MQSAYSPPILFDDEYCAQRTDLFQPYKFPYVLRKNETYNSKLYTSMKFGLVFSGHILSLQQTYYCVVCERLKRKNGKATSTVWRQPYSIKHVDPTFPIQYIEFWISRQPAHSTIEQRGKVIYFHCQSIVPFPTFSITFEVKNSRWKGAFKSSSFKIVSTTQRKWKRRRDS